MSVEKGAVFVSYRREDSGDAAGRLADRLVDRLGADRVFMDVDAIEPGMDYVEVLTRAVAACDVLVAVIGPGWLSAADKAGRRLDDPHDDGYQKSPARGNGQARATRHRIQLPARHLLLARLQRCHLR